MVIGGINEDIPLKPVFLNSAFLVKEVKLTTVE
jgi:hypothetical protein